MTAAIEKLLTLFEIDFAERGNDSVALHESPGGRFVDGQMIAAARAELAALRAENAAQARQIAALREAESIVKAMALYSSRNIGQLTHLMAAAEAYKPVDLPPSSMRLVPLERLKEIEWAWHHCEETDEEWQQCPVCGGYEKGSGHGPHCWLSAAIAGKEAA